MEELDEELDDIAELTDDEIKTNFEPGGVGTLVRIVKAKRVREISPKNIAKIPDRSFNFEGEDLKDELSEKFVEQLEKDQLDIMAKTRGDGGVVSFISGALKKKICAIKNPNWINLEVFGQLDAETIDELSAEQLNMLDLARVRAMRMEQWDSIKKDTIQKINVGYISPEMLGQLKHETIDKFTPVQIAEISNEQLKILTPVQAATLNRSKIKALVNSAKLHFLADQVLSTLKGGGVLKGQDNQIKELVDNNKIGLLSPDFVCQIPLSTINGLETKVRKNLIGQLTKEQLNTLFSKKTEFYLMKDVDSIPKDVFGTLESDVIALLIDNKRLADLSDGQLGALTFDQINNLDDSYIKIIVESGRLHLLSYEALRALEDWTVIKGKPEQIKKLVDSNKIGALSIEFIRGMPTTEINGLTPEVHENFIKQFTKEQLDEMAVVTEGGLMSLGVTKKICNIKVNYVSVNTFGGLKSETIAALTVTQMGDLKAELLGVLTVEQVVDLSYKQIEALAKNNKLQHLSDHVLEQLGDKIILKNVNDHAEQLASLVKSDKVKFLSTVAITKIADSLIKGLSGDLKKKFFEQLTPAQLDAMAKAGKIRTVAEDPNLIPISTFKKLSAEAMAGFSGKQFAKFDKSYLEALTPVQVEKLGPEQTEGMSSANKLQHLPGNVLSFLSKNNKIGNLSEEQLGSLLGADKLKHISRTLVSMKKNNKLGSIGNSKLLESIISVDFDTEKGQIAIGAETIGLIRGKVTSYAEGEDVPSIIISEDAKEYVAGQIAEGTREEDWSRMGINGLRWIMGDSQHTGTVLEVLKDGVNSLSKNVYELIDGANLLKNRIALNNNEKETAADYVRLKEVLERLVRVANYNCIDEYISAMDLISSLVEDKDVDIDYRIILSEELMKLGEKFLAGYYGVAEDMVLHPFTREKLGKIYLNHVQIIAEKNNIDLDEFSNKLRQNEKDKNIYSNLNKHEIDCLNTLKRATRIYPPGDGTVNDIASRVAPWVGVARTAMVTCGVTVAAQRATRNPWLTSVLAFIGFGVTVKKAKDAAEINSYMNKTVEERQILHKKERKQSKERSGKPFFVFIYGFARAFGRLRMRTTRFFTVLFKIKKKSATGFERLDYSSSAKKENESKKFREGCLRQIKKDILIDEKEKYTGRLADISDAIVGNIVKGQKTAKEQKTVDERVVGLVTDLDEMKKELLDCWLKRKDVELATEFPELKKITKDGILKKLLKVVAGTAKGIAGGGAPVLMGLAGNILNQAGVSGVLTSLQRIEFEKKLEAIRREYNAYAEKLEEDKARRLAELNESTKVEFGKLKDSRTERMDKIRKDMGKFPGDIGENAGFDNVIDFSNINISAKIWKKEKESNEEHPLYKKEREKKESSSELKESKKRELESEISFGSDENFESDGEFDEGSLYESLSEANEEVEGELVKDASKELSNVSGLAEKFEKGRGEVV
ncbi:MAG: hypothetical protein LBI29_00410 [Rickettsiales bacterium]|jgi:hypothetical protein|nr:hypothetical protein [Rickettsiales bacterium]